MGQLVKCRHVLSGGRRFKSQSLVNFLCSTQNSFKFTQSVSLYYLFFYVYDNTFHELLFLTASEFTLPSLYRRITAEIIDFVLLFIMKFGVTLFIIEYMGIVDPSSFMMRFLIEEIDEDSTFEDLQQMLVFALIYRVVVCGYETFFLRYGLGNTVGGATPGKYCMGLRVVSCDRVQGLGGNKALVVSPENLTYLQALLRAVIKNFSMAFFFPACITVFFNPHFRAAYDILTRTVVVSVPNWAERLRPQNR